MKWFSADEALALLGGLRQTLYANVSRGRIRARPDPKDSRRSLYHGEDVKRLAGRRTVEAVAAKAIGWGDPVLASGISTVADGRLWYRGHDAVELTQSGVCVKELCSYFVLAFIYENWYEARQAPDALQPV
jgi:citrate synthase